MDVQLADWYPIVSNYNQSFFVTVEPLPPVVKEDFVFVPPPIIEETVEEIVEEPEPDVPAFVPVWDFEEKQPDENADMNKLADELRQ